MDARLYEQWLAAKQAEADAVAERRRVEDVLIESMRINTNTEGTATADVDGYKVKVTGRLNRKIDADKLQELAAECGLDSSTVSALFRWKPELNLSAWKNADDAVKQAFAPAITTTPGRPSFSIERKE